MNTKFKPIIEAGKDYIKRGFSVVTVKGKVPWSGWAKCQEKHFTAEEFEALVKSEKPTGIGNVCGKISGIVVVDVDSEEMNEELKLPKTPTVKTGRGYHYYYKYPADGIESSKPMDKVEIRSDGNIVVAPPSLHISSSVNYKWLIGLDECEMAEFPREIFETKENNTPTESQKISTLIQGVPEGSRNISATKLIGKLLSYFPETEWEDYCWNFLLAVNDRNKPPLDPKELREVFDSISKAARTERKTSDAEMLKEITPAQCFIDNKAIMTVEFSELLGADKDRKFVRVPYVIINDITNSTRKKIRLNENELINLGYYSERTPDLQNRWSIASIKSFLAGKEEVVPLTKIFESLKELYKEFCDFDDNRVGGLMACWVLGTYFHRMFNTYPYLHLNGHMQTGKSKTIFLTTLLSFNGETNVGSTASYLVRSIHENCSTVGIDEAENLGNDEEGKTLIQVLNAGYKSGATIGKSTRTGNHDWKTKRFDPYSPKILGGIKRIVSTLNSRAIPITMLRSNDDKIKNIEVDFKDQRFQALRDQMYIMAMTNFQSVIKTYTELQDTQIKGRDWELWKPVLTIAKIIDESTYQELHNLAIKIQAQKTELIEDDTSFVAFLESLLYMIDRRNESNLGLDNFYSAAHIESSLIDDLNPNHDSFAWLQGSRKHGRWIGDELRKLGVIKGISEQRKIYGENKRGYELDRSIIEKQIEIYKAQ